MSYRDLNMTFPSTPEIAFIQQNLGAVKFSLSVMMKLIAYTAGGAPANNNYTLLNVNNINTILASITNQTFIQQ